MAAAPVPAGIAVAQLGKHVAERRGIEHAGGGEGDGDVVFLLGHLILPDFAVGDGFLVDVAVHADVLQRLTDDFAQTGTHFHIAGILRNDGQIHLAAVRQFAPAVAVRIDIACRIQHGFRGLRVVFEHRDGIVKALEGRPQHAAVGGLAIFAVDGSRRGRVVDGVGNRLTEIHVVARRAAATEQHLIAACERAFAHVETVHAREAVDQRRFNRVGVVVIRVALAAGQRHHQACLIRVGLHSHLVHGDFAEKCVLRHGLIVGGLGIHIVAHQLVRAAANRRVLAGVVGIILDAFPNVFGVDAGRVHAGGVEVIIHVRLGEGQARRVFAGDLHADQIGQTADLLHVALELEGEDDILVGHGLAVMPDRALVPGEIQHLAVLGNLIAGEEIGLQIAVRVAIDVVALRQTVVIHAAERVRLGGHVEGVVGGRRADDEVFDVLFALGDGAGEREHKRQCEQQGDKLFHSDCSSFCLVRKTTKSTASTIFFRSAQCFERAKQARRRQEERDIWVQKKQLFRDREDP